jgi:hypothetical protein
VTRTNRSARQAGARFERTIANYLAQQVDDRIDRKVRTGARDTGDITGVRHMGRRITIETKDYGGRLLPAQWTSEAHTEMGNDDALAGIVVAKRRAVTDPGSQWVLMTLNDLVALLTGSRPDTDL